MGNYEAEHASVENHKTKVNHSVIHLFNIYCTGIADCGLVKFKKMDNKNEGSSPKVPGSLVERLIGFIWYGVILSLWLGTITFFQEFLATTKKINYEGNFKSKSIFLNFIKSVQYIYDIHMTLMLFLALPKRSGQTVILTGGGRGIGFEVLRKLLQLDYFVVFGLYCELKSM